MMQCKNLTQEQTVEDDKIIQQAIVEAQKRQSQLKSTLKKINRNHKLYFRNHKDVILRLDKVSREIYETIILEFLQGGAAAKYSELNKDIKHWSGFKPIPMFLKPSLEAEFEKVLKASMTQRRDVTISYNGSWQPLVRLTMDVRRVVVE